MKPTLILTLLAAGLASCTTSNRVYEPVSHYEDLEFTGDRIDVYPDDVRNNLSHYDNLRIAWAGIIVSNQVTGDDMSSDPQGKFRMDTVFQHHYFDWEQDEHPDGIKLLISPRGEGNFRMRWKMHRNDPDAPEEKAMKYAAPGKLAIVYGTPEGIDPDGTIVLHYHYIRIVSPAHFSANELDYGRLGQPFKPVDSAPTADATAPPSH
jgi:hypothetical protein